MGFSSSPDADESSSISEINVTPLVDVMLVLLVIFMVAAPILQQGVELELPKESIEAFDGSQEQLVVSIDRKGVVYLGSGTKVAAKQIGKKVKAVLKNKSDKRVFIKADHRVTYGKVMQVMGSIRRAGIDKVGLVTDPS